MDDEKKEARKFGAKGGRLRAKNLTAEERSDIARAGALAMWKKRGVDANAMPTAIYGSPDKPLRLGPIEIQCYVLDDERRVLVQRGLQAGIGMSTSGGTGGAHRLARFIGSLEAKGIQTNNLALRMTKPIVFRPAGSGKEAYGYEATILTEICRAVLEARRQNVLLKSQLDFAAQCELLLGGLADVGIVAMVDEATGFQAVRGRDALAKILESFVQKELRKWVRTFPPEYYEQLCRLRGVAYPPPAMKLPQYFGTLTNNIVYDRLAPGVKDELKRITPKDAKGRPRDKLHQRLTTEIGNPKLLAHLTAVTALMTIAPDYATFEGHLDRALPKWSDQLNVFAPDAGMRALPSSPVSDG